MSWVNIIHLDMSHLPTLASTGTRIFWIQTLNLKILNVKDPSTWVDYKCTCKNVLMHESWGIHKDTTWVEPNPNQSTHVLAWNSACCVGTGWASTQPNSAWHNMTQPNPRIAPLVWYVRLRLGLRRAPPRLMTSPSIATWLIRGLRGVVHWMKIMGVQSTLQWFKLSNWCDHAGPAAWGCMHIHQMSKWSLTDHLASIQALA